MITQTFSTQRLPLLEQLEAWCRWYSPVFEVQPLRPAHDGFPATNWNWNVEGLTVSRVRSPPTSVGRGRQTGREHGLDGAGESREISRRKSREIALEHHHVVSQEPALRGRQNRSLNRLDEMGDPTEVIA